MERRRETRLKIHLSHNFEWSRQAGLCFSIPFRRSLLLVCTLCVLLCFTATSFIRQSRDLTALVVGLTNYDRSHGYEEIVPTAVVYMPFSSYDKTRSYAEIKEGLQFSFDKNYFQNGMEESPFLKIVNFSETVDLILQDKFVAWIWDPFHNQKSYACHMVHQKMQEVQEQVWKKRPDSNSPTWTVGFVDVVDSGKQFYGCPQHMDVFLKNISKEVRYWKRAAVIERSFNDTTKSLNPGKLHGSIRNLLDYPNKKQPGPTQLLPSMPLYHTPINVRTDMVETIATLLQEDSDLRRYNLTLASPIESSLPRPRHVAHFFPPTLKGYRDEAPNFAKLRMSVSQMILQFAKVQNANKSSTNNKVDVLVNSLGGSGERGRSSPQVEYARELLKTKIVVVAQRDTWEDHWRLFEAIISGALVMTDTILAMPDGLVHRESIVMYSSLEELKEKLGYYLDPSNEAERIAIAAKGRFVAMDRHRSWHRMEEIALGEVKSTCEVSRFPQCPYTVHAA